ncbi:uncharacterized protein LY89DRAFT_663965 [Mollisia scopiformis]|uniref:RING-type E3 ubiquitin transferase n=1 Tax=Mollisia scopiformis TaxID=149040 RepID=A0A194XU41_MOLSC|nr:uncharacterized protein LY89DRAFT_663965 [Mollisia scopiformis]KUJ23554.1 hypothetical protein LY89DRAFT_663965 [Mollisia scopiformis]
MSLSGNLAGVDMNNAANLELYSEVLLFKNDSSRDEVLFFHRSNAEQRTLQAIAHSLLLEYEYSAATKVIRISRPTSLDISFLEDLQIGQMENDISARDYGIQSEALDPNDLIPESNGYDNNSFISGPEIMTSPWLNGDHAENTAMSGPNLRDRQLNNHYQQDGLSREGISANAPSGEFSNSMSGDLEPWSAYETHVDRIEMNQIESFTSSLQGVGEGEAQPEECILCHQHNYACTCFTSAPQAYTSEGFPQSSLDDVPNEASLHEQCPTSPNVRPLLQDFDEVPVVHSGNELSVCHFGDCMETFSRSVDLQLHLREHVLTQGLASVSDIPEATNLDWTEEHSLLPNCIRSLQRKRKNSQLSKTSESTDETSDNGVGPRRPYECDLCPRKYFSSKHINRHRKVEHRDAKARFYCSTCQASFDRRISLTNHRISCIYSGGGRTSRNDSREGSVHSGDNAEGFSVSVFDSGSIHSARSSARSANSASSGISVTSGRRGPLSRLARAGMHALKEVGACWRCKVLKKSCDIYDPCVLCPSDQRSNWAKVGCKRGDFQPPGSRLCPSPFARIATEESDIEVTESKIRSLNVAADVERWLQKVRSDDISGSIEEDRVLQNFHLHLHRPPLSQLSNTSLTQLAPLEQCALTILCHFLRCPEARQVLNKEGSLDELGKLLPLAIVYQAEQQDDQLIAQSLICLRVCAEALRAQASGLLSTPWHSICESHNSKLDDVRNLNVHLRLYNKELSRVFFQRENLRNRRPWWLSAFYSFCIQSYVRRALIKLNMELKPTSILATDICSFYEEAVWKTGQRAAATRSVPKQLEAAYAIFYDVVRRGRQTIEFFPSAVYTTWMKFSAFDREWYLKQALLMAVSYLGEISSKSGHPRNPLRISRRRFDFSLKISKLSPEMIAGLYSKDWDFDPLTEAEQYLYLPLRLFKAMNRLSVDPMIFWGGVDIGLKHIDGASVAVDHSTWQEKGISSSYDYLKRLFEDDGRTLEEIATGDPVSMAQINDANLKGECAVCLTHIPAGSDIIVLPCSHWFHETCVVAWLQEINTCPQCGVLVYSEDEVGLDGE